MLVEIPLNRRLALCLRHPSYATTVVLAGILLGAGTGSFGAASLREQASLVFAAGVLASVLALVRSLPMDESLEPLDASVDSKLRVGEATAFVLNG